MNADIYELLREDDCYSKTHGDFFETYDSHVNLCLAFLGSVSESLNYHNGSTDKVRIMVKFHDIGKLGREFQDHIRGKKGSQYIHHTELAFVKWLLLNVNGDNGDQDLPLKEFKELEFPYILAILGHHRTLIDEESAIIIERLISNHPKWKDLSIKWLDVLKRPTVGRVDQEFLLALSLIDILRTVDIIASYTSETIYKKHIIKEQKIPQSLFGNSFNKISEELSSMNIRSDELEYRELSNDEKIMKVELYKPVNSTIEYVRKGES